MGQQVTALTAEKSLELADENIVDAVISGGHLILRRRNWDPAAPTAPGTFIDAGSVIGATGPTGAPGRSSHPTPQDPQMILSVLLPIRGTHWQALHALLQHSSLGTGTR